MESIVDQTKEYLARVSRIDFDQLPPTIQDDIRSRVGAAVDRLGRHELSALCQERGLLVVDARDCVVPTELTPEMLNAGVSAVAAAIQKSNGPIKWEDGIIEAWKRIIAARPTAANGVRERFISAA